MHVLRKHFPDIDKFNLMRKKGIFPYEWMDSWDKLKKPLPEKEEFFSTLTNSDITDEEFKRAKDVYEKFKCKNMEEYLLLYLMCDVLLLVDIFENFRVTCLEKYKLDPTHYHTAPSLAWDAMLFITKIRLQLFTDMNMYMFMEEGRRGGLVQASLR